MENTISKTCYIFILFGFISFAGCQKNGINGNTTGNLGTACASSTPACPTGVGTCAYLTWDEASIGDPNVAPPILYNIYYGTTSGLYTNQVTSVSQTCYQLTGLSPGTYYFAASAYNSAGSSSYSNEASMTSVTLDQLKSDPKQKLTSEISFVVPSNLK